MLPVETWGRLATVSRLHHNAEQAVSARPLAGSQQRLTYGDHFIRPAVLRPFVASWGVIVPLSNLLRARVNAGDTSEEVEGYLLHVHRRYADGWRVCLEHEDGQTRLVSLHMSECWPVRPEEYALAAEHNWNSTSMRGALWLRTVVARIRAQMAAGHKGGSQ